MVLHQANRSPWQIPPNKTHCPSKKPSSPHLARINIMSVLRSNPSNTYKLTTSSAKNKTAGSSPFLCPPIPLASLSTPIPCVIPRRGARGLVRGGRVRGGRTGWVALRNREWSMDGPSVVFWEVWVVLVKIMKERILVEVCRFKMDGGGLFRMEMRMLW